MEERLNQTKTHNLIMEERKKLSLSGVNDVTAFDEERVTITTTMGILTISGQGLHIGNFSRESGELNMDGEVYALSYEELKEKSKGFLANLFR